MTPPLDELELLAIAIDARDSAPASHIPRVRRHAVALARALGVPDDEVGRIEIAAVLHDIGRLAIPAHVYSKPGPLTPEEFERIRRHPSDGADILASVPSLAAAAPIVRGHHERWDGRGYPDGLEEDAIPFGARILAVVDYFDALQTPAPWHEPLAPEAALEVLRQEAGKGLDPAVVGTFVEILPGLSGEPAAVAPHGLARVYREITTAHREDDALYRVAVAMAEAADVSGMMDSVAAVMGRIVPFDCCALFLHDEEAGVLACKWASGADAETIRRIRVPVGEGLTGWVARNRRALVNARPSADLEASGIDAGTALQSALASPLLLGEGVFGVVAAYHRDVARYSDDHRRVLDTVAEPLAQAVNRALHWDAAIEDSLTDARTGLPNAKFFFMHITRELARAERLSAQVAVLVMDLDGFKRIRSRFGREVATRVLCEAASVLRARLRPYDICVRYEKDEFIIVLFGVGPEEAAREAVDIQALVDTAWLEADGERVPIAGSIGAAVFPDDGASYEAVIAAASARMRADKERRRGAPGRTPGV